MIEGWHRPEYAKKELPILKEKIDKEKDPKMRNLLIARYGYLEKEAYPFDSFMKELNKGTAKGFITGVVIKAAMNIPQGRGITLGIIGAKALYNIYQGAKEEPKIAITFTQANDIKKIAPEFYKDAESLFRIGNKSDVSNSALIGAAENYYKNNKTPDGKTGDIVGFLAGAKVGGDFAGKALNRPVTYIYKSPNPSLVPVNEVTNGGQLLLEYKAMNTLPATNGTLVTQLLTTGGTLATVPLLADGANKIIRKTDFYVGSDGASSTLPATAYRYLDSKAYVETKKNMTGNLSYFGFKKFDAAYQARDGFQIKYDYYNQNDPYRSWSNAVVRGTFDTLQLYDNTTGKLKVRIPYTFGDTGKDLEPFTESYPEYGQGGELQMIRLRWDEDLIIKYDRLDILPNPRTDLILKEEIIK